MNLLSISIRLVTLNLVIMALIYYMMWAEEATRAMNQDPWFQNFLILNMGFCATLLLFTIATTLFPKKES
jgi:hypothetical protein